MPMLVTTSLTAIATSVCIRLLGALLSQLLLQQRWQATPTCTDLLSAACTKRMFSLWAYCLLLLVPAVVAGCFCPGCRSIALLFAC